QTQLQEDDDKLNREIVKLRNTLPPEPAVDQIRSSVDAAAQDSGVRIERFQPKDSVKREYIEVPIDTTAIGNLSQLEPFFGRIVNKSRVMNVTEVTLTQV